MLQLAKLTVAASMVAVCSMVFAELPQSGKQYMLINKIGDKAWCLYDTGKVKRADSIDSGGWMMVNGSAPFSKGSIPISPVVLAVPDKHCNLDGLNIKNGKRPPKAALWKYVDHALINAKTGRFLFYPGYQMTAAEQRQQAQPLRGYRINTTDPYTLSAYSDWYGRGDWSFKYVARVPDNSPIFQVKTL